MREALEAYKKRSSNERRDQIVSIASVFIALAAAAAAIWSGYEAHVARIADDRPFLSADVDDLSDYMVLHSLGKTPAVNIEAVCLIDENEQKVDWQRVEHPQVVHRHLSLFPGQTDGFPCERLPFHSVNEVRYGMVKYKDPEGRSYQTPFCYVNLMSREDKVFHACSGIGPAVPEFK